MAETVDAEQTVTRLVGNIKIDHLKNPVRQRMGRRKTPEERLYLHRRYFLSAFENT